jgi:hypothetical protein
MGDNMQAQNTRTIESSSKYVKYINELQDALNADKNKSDVKLNAQLYKINNSVRLINSNKSNTVYPDKTIESNVIYSGPKYSQNLGLNVPGFKTTINDSENKKEERSGNSYEYKQEEHNRPQDYKEEEKDSTAQDSTAQEKKRLKEKNAELKAEDKYEAYQRYLKSKLNSESESESKPILNETDKRQILFHTLLNELRSTQSSSSTQRRGGTKKQLETEGLNKVFVKLMKGGNLLDEFDLETYEYLHSSFTSIDNKFKALIDDCLKKALYIKGEKTIDKPLTLELYTIELKTVVNGILCLSGNDKDCQLDKKVSKHVKSLFNGEKINVNDEIDYAEIFDIFRIITAVAFIRTYYNIFECLSVYDHKRVEIKSNISSPANLFSNVMREFSRHTGKDYYIALEQIIDYNKEKFYMLQQWISENEIHSATMGLISKFKEYIGLLLSEKTIIRQNTSNNEEETAAESEKEEAAAAAEESEGEAAVESEEEEEESEEEAAVEAAEEREKESEEEEEEEEAAAVENKEESEGEEAAAESEGEEAAVESEEEDNILSFSIAIASYLTKKNVENVLGENEKNVEATDEPVTTVESTDEPVKTVGEQEEPVTNESVTNAPVEEETVENLTVTPVEEETVTNKPVKEEPVAPVTNESVTNKPVEKETVTNKPVKEEPVAPVTNESVAKPVIEQKATVKEETVKNAQVTKAEFDIKLDKKVETLKNNTKDIRQKFADNVPDSIIKSAYGDKYIETEGEGEGKGKGYKEELKKELKESIFDSAINKVVLTKEILAKIEELKQKKDNLFSNKEEKDKYEVIANKYNKDETEIVKEKLETSDSQPTNIQEINEDFNTLRFILNHLNTESRKKTEGGKKDWIEEIVEMSNSVLRKNNMNELRGGTTRTNHITKRSVYKKGKKGGAPQNSTQEKENPNFHDIVEKLTENVYQIISNPIWVKFKSLKPNMVAQLSKRTVIYENKDKESFYPTGDLIKIIMDFLFVDYTSLDVFKQIYYYYQREIDNKEDTSEVNVIKQHAYTHSGIEMIINTILNKFTYDNYYPDFIDEMNKDTNKANSTLEKDNQDRQQKFGNTQTIEYEGIESTKLKEKLPTTRRYMYVVRFLDLLREFRDLERKDNHSNFYIQNMFSVIILNHIENIGNVNHVLKLMIQPYNTDFFELLNHLVRLQNSKLITYVKINNYENPMNMKEKMIGYDPKNNKTNFTFINDYNRRFKIYVNNPNITDNWRLTDIQVDKSSQSKETRTGLKTLAIRYNDDDFPYYERKDGRYFPSSNVIQCTEGTEGKCISNDNSNDKFDILTNTDGTKLLNDVKKYESTYFFGRFNQIFLPHYSNREVAQNMENIIQLITKPGVDKKKFFSIGYGASGAGKTSSLIYLNKGDMENREGIIIHLCKRLGEMGYNNVDVTTKEFFSCPKNQDFEEHLKKFEDKNILKWNGLDNYGNETGNTLYTIERGVFEFEYKAEKSSYKEFIFKKPNSVPTRIVYGDGNPSKNISAYFGNVHTYRTFETYEDSKQNPSTRIRFPNPQFDEEKQETKDDAVVNLGKLLIYLIDSDRLVKATTNNPNSSRSHVLLFLKLSRYNHEDDKYAKDVDIIIGDFAGVENKFECDPVSISNFLSIEKDVDPKYLYYKPTINGDAITLNDMYHGGGGDVLTRVQKKNLEYVSNIAKQIKSLKDSKYTDDSQSQPQEEKKEEKQSEQEEEEKKEEKQSETKEHKWVFQEGEYELNGEKGKKDLVEYLLSKDNDSLINILDKNDTTILQKALEWVGKYKDEFDEKVKQITGQEGQGSQGNILKLTMKERNFSKMKDELQKKLDGITSYTKDNKLVSIDNYIELLGSNSFSSSSSIGNDVFDIYNQAAKSANEIVIKGIEEEKDKVLNACNDIIDSFETTFGKDDDAGRFFKKFEKIQRDDVDTKMKNMENMENIKSYMKEIFGQVNERITRYNELLGSIVNVENVENNFATISHFSGNISTSVNYTKSGIDLNRIEYNSDKRIVQGQGPNNIQKMYYHVATYSSTDKVYVGANTYDDSTKKHNTEKNIEYLYDLLKIFFEFTQKDMKTMSESLEKSNQEKASQDEQIKKFETDVEGFIAKVTNANTLAENLAKNFRDNGSPTLDFIIGSIDKSLSDIKSQYTALSKQYNDLNQELPKDKQEVLENVIKTTDTPYKNYLTICNKKKQEMLEKDMNAFKDYSEKFDGENIDVKGINTAEGELEKLQKELVELNEKLKTDENELESAIKSIAPFHEFSKEQSDFIDGKYNSNQNIYGTPVERQFYVSKNGVLYRVASKLAPTTVETVRTIYKNAYNSHIKELKTEINQKDKEITKKEQELQKLKESEKGKIGNLPKNSDDLKKRLQEYYTLSGIDNSQEQKFDEENEKKIKKMLDNKFGIKKQTSSDADKYTNIIKDFNEKMKALQEIQKAINSENAVNQVLSKNGRGQTRPAQTGGGTSGQDRYNENIKIVNQIKDAIDKLHNYYKSGQSICENRTKEGIFINRSLEEVRKTIQELLIFNAEGSLELAPDFIEHCMRVYCPIDKECFKMEQVASGDDAIDSVLFKAIYDHYYSTSQVQDKPSKKTFFNELIVNIFCVLNITKYSNNPPVVPYIDTNSLKINFYNQLYKKTQDGEYPHLKKLFEELIKVLSKIAKYPNKLKELNDSPDIKSLSQEYLEITLPVNDVNNPKDNKQGVQQTQDNKTPSPPSPESSILTVDEYKFIIDKVSNAQEKLNGNLKNYTNIIKNKAEQIKFEQYMNTMLTLIEKTNAASVIGTLEFVDTMSKFGTVENLCNIDDITLEETKDNEPDAKFESMQKIYQLHEISNSEYENDASKYVNFFKLLSDHYKYEEKINKWESNESKSVQETKETENTIANQGGNKNRTAKKHSVQGKRRVKTEKNTNM